MPSFVQALVVFCMSVSGQPQPPWLTCDRILSPVVAFDPSDIRPGEEVSYSLGRQCRMAIHDRMAVWVHQHPESGWWLAGVDCRPLFPKQMG